MSVAQEYIGRIVASAQPLTPEQRETITAAFAGFSPATIGGASD